MKMPDHTEYSVAELREALSTVDGTRYPEKKAALEAELQKRIDSGDVEREKQAKLQEEHDKEQRLRLFARRARTWIGLYLLGAPLILFNAGTQTPEGLGWLAYGVYGLVYLYVGIAALAGFGLWKHKEWGRRLAIVVFAIQVLTFQSSFMQWHLESALSLFFVLTASGGFDFGFYFNISIGGFRFVVGETGLPFSIGFNLFALFMMWLLFKAREPLDGDEEGIDTHPEEIEERPDLR